MIRQTTSEQGIETGSRGESFWADGGHSVREQIQYVCETAQTSEHQREMSFLRHLMLYGQTHERHALEERITQAERNERCARRAVSLMAVLTGLAVAGLGYSAILLEDFPQNKTQFAIRAFCVLGLAALTSLLAFMLIWLLSRGELNAQREGCRRLVTKIVESHLGKPATLSAAEPSR